MVNKIVSKNSLRRAAAMFMAVVVSFSNVSPHIVMAEESVNAYGEEETNLQEDSSYQNAEEGQAPAPDAYDASAPEPEYEESQDIQPQEPEYGQSIMNETSPASNDTYQDDEVNYVPDFPYSVQAPSGTNDNSDAGTQDLVASNETGGS